MNNENRMLMNKSKKGNEETNTFYSNENLSDRKRIKCNFQ